MWFFNRSGDRSAIGPRGVHAPGPEFSPLTCASADARWSYACGRVHCVRACYSVLLGLVMLARIVMMCCLQVVMCGGRVVGGSLVMVLGCGCFVVVAIVQFSLGVKGFVVVLSW